jgi:membrane associated rhomboid family serine protease
MQPVTRWLITANIGVFLLQLLFGDSMVVRFALWPLGSHHSGNLGITVGFEPWQLVTSALLHGGFAHLGLNMFALYMFGRDVEAEMGSGYFLALYSASVLAAACVQLAVVTMESGGGAFPTLGASGGVFGVLLAFGLLFPQRTIVLLLPPLPMPAWLFVILYGVIELVNGVIGTQAGVAHFAHLGGMLGGGLVFLLWRSRHGGRRGHGWRLRY